MARSYRDPEGRAALIGCAEALGAAEKTRETGLGVSAVHSRVCLLMVPSRSAGSPWASPLGCVGIDRA